MSLQQDDDPHDVAPFFRKETYLSVSEFLLEFLQTPMFTVRSLVIGDTGTSPNVVNKDFLPWAWRKSTETIESQLFRTLNRKVESVEGIVPFLVCMCYLRVCTGFEKVENLAVDVVLGTSFTDCCIWRIFPSERKVVLWHTKPLAVISTQKKVNTIASGPKEADVHTTISRGSPIEENHLCCIARQFMIPA